MKKLYLLLFSLCPAIYLLGQAPSNDEPINPDVLTVVPLGGTINSVIGTTANATVTDTPSVPPAPSSCGCTSSTTAFPNDVWYIFNSGSFNSFQLTVSSTNYIGAPGYVRVYQNISHAGTPISCYCSPSAQQAIGTVYINNLAPNTDYYIAVSPKVGTNGFWGPFEINIFGSNTPLAFSELYELHARKINDKSNKIFWSVESAKEIEKFVLQRKNIENQFEDIATILAENQLLDYNHYDYTFLPNNIAEYRIKVVLNSGSLHYSNVAKVINNSKIEAFNYFPNPGSTQLNISRTLADNEAIISIFDYQGRKIFTRNLEPNEKEIQVETKNFPEGLLLLYYKALDNPEVIVRKWQKLN